MRADTSKVPPWNVAFFIGRNAEDDEAELAGAIEARNPVYSSISGDQTHDFSEKPGLFASGQKPGLFVEVSLRKS